MSALLLQTFNLFTAICKCTHIDIYRIASSHHKILEEGNRLPSQPSAEFTKDWAKSHNLRSKHSPLSLELNLLNRQEKNQQNRNLKLTHQSKSSALLRKPLLCGIVLLVTNKLERNRRQAFFWDAANFRLCETENRKEKEKKRKS
ncbi:hypothetical protein VIGAN_07010600 [Vigna angularis var. angularis]|uniref:Uncharacterized protein n=1 Tax=Vigna angularis var. angularis TaxID=157739 RepID=A0A0S3SF92_PHAAN|nr:hypothetical protein VIGAN_07010600 [Vigna angularis var. angularis]